MNWMMLLDPTAQTYHDDFHFFNDYNVSESSIWSALYNTGRDIFGFSFSLAQKICIALMAISVVLIGIRLIMYSSSYGRDHLKDELLNVFLVICGITGLSFLIIQILKVSQVFH